MSGCVRFRIKVQILVFYTDMCTGHRGTIYYGWSNKAPPLERRCQAGYYNTGGPSLPRKRAPSTRKGQYLTRNKVQIVGHVGWKCKHHLFLFWHGALLRGLGDPPVFEKPARYCPRQGRGFSRPPIMLLFLLPIIRIGFSMHKKVNPATTSWKRKTTFFSCEHGAINDKIPGKILSPLLVPSTFTVPLQMGHYSGYG